MVRSHGTQCLDRRWSTLKKYIPKEFWRPNIQVIETWIRKSETIYFYILYTDLSGDAMCRRMLSRNIAKAPWQGLANEKQQAFSCLNIWKAKNTQFYQSKIIETITKACKYHSKCESTQNALDTKPWKGCRNNNLAAEKVKITGVIAGSMTLFLNWPYLACQSYV